MKNPTESPHEILKKPYSRILIPQDEGGFSAEILEFSGCVAEGGTAQKAYDNLESAALSWVQACLEGNIPFLLQSFLTITAEEDFF